MQADCVEWVCPACTLINPIKEKKCSACLHVFKSKKFVTSSISASDKNNNNLPQNSKNLRSAFNDLKLDVKSFLLGGFNSNGNNENAKRSTDNDFDDIIEIDPRTNSTLKRRTNEPKFFSNNSWVCQKCSYSTNPKWVDKCEMCHSKPQSSIAASTSQKKQSPEVEFLNEKKNDRNKKEAIKIYDKSLNEDIYDYARIWSCKLCTFINFSKDIQCELCLTPRLATNIKQQPNQPSNKPSTPSADQWVCKRCTFFNVKHETKCTLCKEPKNESDKKEQTTKGKWACEICSHKNDPQEKTCVVCSFDTEKNQADSEYAEIHDLEVSDLDELNSVDNSYHDASLTRSSMLNNSILAQRSKTAYKTYANATTHAEKIWKNIVTYCKMNSITFVDDSFPPCEKSLYINGVNKSSGKAKNMEINWLRPNFIRSHSNEKQLKWTVYNDPKFGDIKQGLLGDCWLISAIAVLIEQPEMLRKIIMTKEYCDQGCYQVRLCHNGEWQTVIVDDLFPCDQNGSLIYSQASRKQLWIPLIEKAMAKLNGNYESLIAGQTVEGLSILTGFPCDVIRLEKANLCRTEEEDIDFDFIWVQLLSMKEAGYTMGASCGRLDNTDEKFFTDRGLLSRHAYSILDIKEINGHQLIQLRNPWGRYAWNGDWSESSSKWTPEIRRVLGLKKQQIVSKTKQSALQSDNLYYNQNLRGGDEGIFWMSFNDFRKYFGIIDVCKTMLNLYESRMSGYFNPEGTREMQAYHMVVFEASQIDIGLFHKTTKNRRENSDLDLSFVVLKDSGNKNITGKLVTSSNRAVRKFIGREHLFTPGEYLIIPISLNFWYTKESSKKNHEEGDDKDYNNLYNLVIHSSKEFFIEQEMHHAFLLADTMIQLCLQLGQPKKQDIPDATVYALSKNWSGLIVVVENASPHAYLHIEVECLKSMNVVSTRQTLCTVDSVPPCHRQVLIALTHLEGSNGYSINYNISYRASSNAMLNTWPRLEGQKITNSPGITKKTFGLHAPRSMFLFN